MAKVRITTPPRPREEQLAALDDVALACRADGCWWEVTFGWGAREPGTGRKDAEGRIIEGTGRIVKNWSTWYYVCQRPGCKNEKRVIRTAYQDERNTTRWYGDDYLLEGERPAGGTRREARQEIARRQTR